MAAASFQTVVERHELPPILLSPMLSTPVPLSAVQGRPCEFPCAPLTPPCSFNSSPAPLPSRAQAAPQAGAVRAPRHGGHCGSAARPAAPVPAPASAGCQRRAPAALQAAGRGPRAALHRARAGQIRRAPGRAGPAQPRAAGALELGFVVPCCCAAPPCPRPVAPGISCFSGSTL